MAPEAVNVPELPAQMVIGLTETTGFGFTVTTALAVFEQPLVVPVTTKVTVELGVAVTLAPVVADKSVAGDQE